MEFWEEDCQKKVEQWKKNSKPLLLIGPTGVGKTTVAQDLLKNHDVKIFYPTAFRDSKQFMQDLKNTMNHGNILQILSNRKPKSILIENVDELTSTESTVIKYLSKIHNPPCPIIMTARKPEKRHRDLLRGCHTVKIYRLNPYSPHLVEEQRQNILKGETNIRSLFRPNETTVNESEDISILSAQILKGEIHHVPDTLSLTEKSILLNTLKENLADRLSRTLQIFTDRVFSRIFTEERWDLIHMIDDYVIPKILQEIQEHGTVEEPTFSMMLSRISTQSLNRKTIIENIQGCVDDPVVHIHKVIQELPERFRVKQLFSKSQT